MSDPGWTRTDPPTDKRGRFVRSLQRCHRLPDALLDSHCVARFRVPDRALDRARVSAPIDEMLGWADLPAGLARPRCGSVRAKGQRDLPAFG